MMTLDQQIRETLRAFYRTGNQLVETWNRRDSLRESLCRRRPHWIDDDEHFELYKQRLRKLLVEAEGTAQFQEATMTKLSEELAELQWRERRVESIRQEQAQPQMTLAL